MRNLPLRGLKMGLDDLLRREPDEEGHAPRRNHIEGTRAGGLYLPLLEQQKEAIDALPEALIGPPLKEQVSSTDLLHDGLGEAIICQTDAIIAHPRFDQASKEAAKRVQETFSPSRGELRSKPATEAARAVERRKKIAEREADLRLLVVPRPRSGSDDEPAFQTLYDWVDDFLKQGEELDRLLSRRASITAEAARELQERAGIVRVVTIGILGRFRESLQDERKFDPALPANIDALVFGYFDQLAASSTTSGSGGPPSGSPPGGSPPT
ncbi:MAG: hypothetical protein KJ626_13800 [Verrucomicrobia bacterium]|nr:hypothetical protein [Verrucomicrobiota bacterium]